jgi:hypothetical protein
MNATPLVLPKAKRPQSVGAFIFLIIVYSLSAGSYVERALWHYREPKQPFEWTGDLIMALGLLTAAIISALRIRREVPSGG